MKTNRIYTTSLDDAGLLRRGEPNNDDHPVWFRVQNAWASMPGGAGLGRALREGMTVDEAFEQEAKRLEAFAENLRRWFAEKDAAERELRELRAQRHAMRVFLGTGAAS